MTAFLTKQRAALEALAAPGAPGESVKTVIARVARRAGLTRSKAAKAWRGYTILRADEWDRVQRSLGRRENEGRSEYATIGRELAAIAERLVALEADAARAVDREAGGEG